MPVGSIHSAQPWYTVCLDTMGHFRLDKGRKFIIFFIVVFPVVLRWYRPQQIKLPAAHSSATSVVATPVYLHVFMAIEARNSPELSGRIYRKSWAALQCFLYPYPSKTGPELLSWKTLEYLDLKFCPRSTSPSVHLSLHHRGPLLTRCH